MSGLELARHGQLHQFFQILLQHSSTSGTKPVSLTLHLGRVHGIYLMSQQTTSSHIQLP